MTQILVSNNALQVDTDSSTNFYQIPADFIFVDDSGQTNLVSGADVLSVGQATSFSLVDQTFLTYPHSDTGIEDAAYDNKMYVRKNGAWLILDRVSFPTELDSYLYSKVDDLLDWQRIATGNSLDVEGRYVSIRDLLLMGIIVRTEDGYDYLEPGVDIITTGPQFMAIPPAPTDVRAIRDITNVTVFWNPANLFYSNHGFTEIFRNTINDLATATKIKQTGSLFTDTDQTINATDAYYYWVRFVSLTGVEGPFNNVDGTLAVPLEPSALLEILGGSITAVQLHPSLLAPIELITAPDGLVNSQIQLAETIAQETAARIDAIEAEAVARQQALLLEAVDRGNAITTATNILESADQNLAERVDFVTSVTNGTFDTKKIWQFDLLPAEGVDVTEGWTSNGGIPVVANGKIRPYFSIDTYLTSPAFTIEGSAFPEIRLRIKKIGNPLWQGTVQFSTTGMPTFNLTNINTIPAPVFFAGEAVVRFNMSDAANWDLSIITGIRIQLSLISDASNYFEIDWIGVGRVGPAASIAAIAEERVAWTTADAAEAALRTTLAAQIRGGYTGTDLDSVSSGLIYEEKSARATADSALAVQMALLTAGTSNQFDYSQIWYFDSSIEGWSGSVTPTISTVGWLRPGDSGTYPYVESPVLNIPGETYPQLRARVKKTGTPAFLGQLEYITAADSSWGTAGKVATIAEPGYEDGIGYLTWNLDGLWLTSTVTKVRITVSSAQTGTDYFELDWIAVGRPSPGASSAELLDLQQVVTTGFTALGEDITVINASLENKAESSAVSVLETEVSDINGVLTSQGSAITALKSSLGGGNNLITNSEVENSSVGWDLSVSGAATLLESGLNLFIDMPTGVNTLCGRVSTNSSGSGNLDIKSSVINLPEFLAKVSPGSRYCLSASMAGSSIASGSVGVVWYDITNTVISNAFSTPASIPSLVSVDSVPDMYRAYVFAIAPSNAVYAQVIIRGTVSASTSSASLVTTKPMLEEVSSSQLFPSIYEPSLVGVASTVFATAEATEALITEVTQISGVTAAQVNQISTLRASLREDNAEGDLASALAGWRSEVVFTEEVAARVTKDEANLQKFTELDAATATSSANISNLETAVASNNLAVASQINTLTAAVEDNSAQIGTEILARVTAQEAITSQITTMGVVVNGNTAAIANEITARVNSDNATASSISLLQTKYNQNNAAIITEVNTRTSADAALATSITMLTSTVNSNNSTLTGAVNNEITVRTNQVEVLTQTTNTLSATVDNNTAAIQTTASTVATLDGSLAALYSVKLGVTVDGKYYAAGMGIGIENTPVGMQSNVIFLADKFQVMHSTAAGVTPAVPFTVVAGKVIINSAVIGDATISFAKIDDTIQSVDYVPGVTGWRISKNNWAEFFNIKVRGDIEASSLKAGTAMVGTIRSTNYIANTSGWNCDAAGNAEFNNVKARGDIEAQSLKANTVMVNTLNVAGEAVTVVRFGQGSSGNIGNNTTVTVLTMASITLPTSVSGIVINMSCTVSTSGSNCNVFVEVYRNGTLIGERHAGAIFDMSLCVSAVFYDSSPGTAPVYALKMRAGPNPGGAGGGDYFCGSPTLTIVGAKR